MKNTFSLSLVFAIFFFCNQLYGNEKNDDRFIKNVLFTYENDSVYGKDRYYTNGVQLLFVTKDIPDDNENRIVSKLFNIKNKSLHNYSFGIGQKIYTPDDIDTKELIKNDRPYAGYLYIFLDKNIIHENKIDAFGVSLGLTGPSSLAEKVQTNVHDWIGSPIPEGWDNQLSNEFLFMLSWMRTIELHESKPYEYDWKFIPKISANVGTPFTDANIGAEFRFGWNLERDMIQNRIKPLPLGIKKNGVNKKYKDMSYYLFLDFEGGLTLYDTFIDGNISGYKPDIDKNIFRYEISAGAALRFQNFYIKCSNIFASKEFKEQKDPQFIFSAIVGYIF